jgi:hypothetical protein
LLNLLSEVGETISTAGKGGGCGREPELRVERPIFLLDVD